MALPWPRWPAVAVLLGVVAVAAGCSSPADDRDASGGSGGAGGTAGGGAAGGCVVVDAGAADASVDALGGCEACELASDTVPSCDPGFLSATKDSSGGPVGWGIDTLATQAERSTGAALLHCLNVNSCSANPSNSGPGDNAALGCFCGSGVAPEDCISGTGVHGVCIPEYEAAAAATPGGPAVCSTLPDVSIFVATATAGYSGPIALAGNIERCAIDASCAVCLGL